MLAGEEGLAVTVRHGDPLRDGRPAGGGAADRRDPRPYRRLHLRQPRQPALRRDDGGDGGEGAGADDDERDLGRPRQLAPAGRAGGLRRCRAAGSPTPMCAMGAEPTFTCAPYLLDPAPKAGEALGWSESNAVIYANSVLGARTVKHPDFLDLFIALTGRAPLVGRLSRRGPGRAAGDRGRPARRRRRRGLAADRLSGRARRTGPDPAADRAATPRGRRPTTSRRSAPPSARRPPHRCCTSRASRQRRRAPPCRTPTGRPSPARDLARAWQAFNEGPEAVDLVAIGSPHFSLAECRALAGLLDGRRAEGTQVIVTLGRAVLAAARDEGLLPRLEGVRGAGHPRSLLVFDQRAGLSALGPHGDDQFGEVRPLRPRTQRPRDALRQPRRLRASGDDRARTPGPAGLARLRGSCAAPGPSM